MAHAVSAVPPSARTAVEPSEIRVAPLAGDRGTTDNTVPAATALHAPSNDDYPRRDGVQPIDEDLDHWIEENGKTFAGRHLIVDLWGAERLDDIGFIEDTLREAVEVAGATLLHIHLHHFTPNGGVSGVAVLAESHISIHSWPERNYAALDVFMCGDAKPAATVPVLERAFRPDAVHVGTFYRGDDRPDWSETATREAAE